MGQTKMEIPLERFKKACLRYSLHYKLSAAETWEDLPDQLQDMFCHMEYNVVIKPFVCFDRNRAGLSWGALSIKYGLPQTTLWRMAACCTSKTPS